MSASLLYAFEFISDLVVLYRKIKISTSSISYVILKVKEAFPNWFQRVQCATDISIGKLGHRRTRTENLEQVKYF